MLKVSLEKYKERGKSEHSPAPFLQHPLLNHWVLGGMINIQKAVPIWCIQLDELGNTQTSVYTIAIISRSPLCRSCSPCSLSLLPRLSPCSLLQPGWLSLSYLSALSLFSDQHPPALLITLFFLLSLFFLQRGDPYLFTGRSHLLCTRYLMHVMSV